MTKIGIFDSGIGGLSILREVHHLNLNHDIYYIADSINNPYGLKDPDFVIKRCHELVELFLRQGISNIVIACNTATALAIDELRANFPEVVFIGVEPYINVINHRVDLKDKSGVVLATPLTGSSRRFKELKQRYDPDSVLEVLLPKTLASVIEHNFFSRLDLTRGLRESLNDAVGKFDFYILGCTHYPLVSKQLEQILGGEMISGCESVARRVNDLVLSSTLNNNESFQFLKTNEGPNWKTLSYNSVFLHS